VQAELAKLLGEILGAFLFGKRSGGDGTDADVFFGNRRGVGFEKTQRRFDLR